MAMASLSLQCAVAFACPSSSGQLRLVHGPSVPPANALLRRTRCPPPAFRSARCSSPSTPTEENGGQPQILKGNGSWSPKDPADPFGGWDPNPIPNPNPNSNDPSELPATPRKGWLKAGGSLVLAIGFALGAHSLYHRKATPSELAVPLPAKEEILSDKQILSLEVHEKQISEGAYNDSEQNEKSHQKEITSGQVSSSASEKVDDVGGKEPNTLDLEDMTLSDDTQIANSNEHQFEDTIIPSTEDSSQSISLNDRSLESADIKKKDEATPQNSHEISEPIPYESTLEGEFSDSNKQNSETVISNGHIDSNRSNSLPESYTSLSDIENAGFVSIGVPAPTIQSTVGESLGKVVVPLQVDHVHEQALAALQALKVIESGVDPSSICTRRDYARWLISASGALTRSPTFKVFPAMYIENFSELAFDDVSPEDPDFAFIQGLAEAGLISSKLSKFNGADEGPVVFSPDSPITRQDLVSWKIALERRSPITVSKEDLEAKTGFIDIDKIHKDAWAALLMDVATGDRSIVALAFGYTRRFQPDKPVTRAQAAVALASGESAEIVQEELARIEAESIAEAAVTAELVSEVKAEKEVVAAFNASLEQEKERREAAEKDMESVKMDLEQLRVQWEEEKYPLLKEKAVIESEKSLLGTLRQELEFHAQSLSSTQQELELEKERLKRLRIQVEEETDSLMKARTELEVEKRALNLARLWAEEEAKRAQNHAKVLEEVRKRWEEQGAPVEVDGNASPASNWAYSQEEVKVGKKSLVDDVLMKSNDFKVFATGALSSVCENLQETVKSSSGMALNSLQETGKKIETLRDNSGLAAVKTAQNIQKTVNECGTRVVSGLREGSKRVADECKGGAEKLAQKLKIN